MLSALLAVALVMTPPCTAEVQPGVVVFALDAPVDVAMLDLSSGGRTWRERPSFDRPGYSVRWDASALPPFADIDYRWSGTLPDMTAVECAGTVTLADTAQDWMSARGDRATVWWYDQPVEYGLRALATVDAQLARLAGLPGGVERVRLVIYQAQADYEDAGMRSGVAFGDTAVVWPSCGEGYLFETTIPHEVVHLWTRSYSHKLPLWFSEGLAAWSDPGTHEAWAQLAERSPAFTWDEMQGKAYSDVAGQQHWYSQAWALVDYIEREHGLAAVLAYLVEHSNAGFEDALRATIGLNSAQVMQEWRIEAGLEDRPRKALPSGLVKALVIAGHVVALAGLTWWRVKLRRC
jgi:hypothetical protein